MVLVDVRPEEVPEWESRSRSRCTPHAGTVRRASRWRSRSSCSSEAKRARGARARTWCCCSTRSAGWRAPTVWRAAVGRRRADAELLAVEGAKRWFGGARHRRGLADADRAGRVESRVARSRRSCTSAARQRPTRSCGSTPELAARGMYPAIDAARSRTLGEEALLPRGPAPAAGALRGVMRSLDPVEAGSSRVRARSRERAEVLGRPLPSRCAARRVCPGSALGRRPASRRARATARSAPSRGPAARSRSCACPRGSRCRARPP